MVDRVEIAGWWQRESQREHTKLECGLLGALFSAIAITFVIVLRLMIL